MYISAKEESQEITLDNGADRTGITPVGDILMMSGELSAAKIKYQFVVQTFPENTASSLALQLLENME